VSAVRQVSLENPEAEGIRASNRAARFLLSREPEVAMRTSILGVLSGALLAACGADAGEDAGGVGEDLDGCYEPTLADFSPPEPFDGLELRTACESGADGTTEAFGQKTYGETCTADRCQREVAAADEAAVAAGSVMQAGQCGSVVVAMRDGTVVGSALSGTELAELLGPIDTLAEAQLVAQLEGLGCVRSGEDDGDYLVVGTEMLAACPIVTREVLYRIEKNGSFGVEARGEKEETGACIGRRPAGLGPRRAPAPVSPVADFLARSAELEAASVLAFQIMEAELAAHGAPGHLLERLRAAARDEVEHAQLMQQLAAQFGGEVTARSVRVRGIRDLETVALENVVEGCVTETWGCLLGMYQAKHARGPALRRAYRRIAADEARHAQLSWDVADWAAQLLPRSSLRRLSEQRAAAVARLARRLSESSEPRPVRQILGLPDAATRRRLFEHVRSELWS
jgi:hypothetical protein